MIDFNLRMPFNFSSGVIIFLLMSSVYSITLSVSQHANRVFIGGYVAVIFILCVNFEAGLLKRALEQFEII